MVGVEHSDPEVLDGGGAALVHAHGVGDTLLLEPACRLQYAEHGVRLRALCYRYRVVDVVEVPMSNEQGIEVIDLLQVVRAGRVAVQPGVHHHALAPRRLIKEGSMPVPG